MERVQLNDPVIDISLKISEGLIDFRVKNKFDPENEEIKDRTIRNRIAECDTQTEFIIRSETYSLH